MSSKHADTERMEGGKPQKVTALFAVIVVALLMSSAVGIINISETKASYTTGITINLTESGVDLDKPQGVGDSVKADYDADTKTAKITLTNLNFVTTSGTGVYIIPIVNNPAAEKIDIALVGDNYIKASMTGLSLYSRANPMYKGPSISIHGDASNVHMPTLTVVSDNVKKTGSTASSYAIFIQSDRLTIRDCELSGTSGNADVECLGSVNKISGTSTGISIDSYKDVQMENCKITGIAGKSNVESSVSDTGQAHSVQAYSIGINLKSADGIDIKKSEISGISSSVTLIEDKDNGECDVESCGIKTTKCTFTDCKISATSGKATEGGSATPAYDSLALYSIGFYGNGDVEMRGTTCNAYGDVFEKHTSGWHENSFSAGIYGSHKMEIVNGSTVSTKPADGVKAHYGIIGTFDGNYQLLKIHSSDVISAGTTSSIVNYPNHRFTNVSGCMKIVDSNGNLVKRTEISSQTEIHIVYNYKVTYKHGDHATGDDVTTTAVYLVDYTISENMFTVGTGWIFDHWTDGETDYKPGDKITNTEKKEEITLTAVCVSEFATVTFDSDGGSPVSSQQVKRGECASEPTAPTKAMYTFVGWYNGSTKWDFNTPVTENITLKAKWDVNTYTVTFDSDGGSPVSSQQVQYNRFVSKPPDPTKTGYTFVGWYNGATIWDFNTPVTENMTLTAVWKEPGSVEVAFDSDGGSGVPPQYVKKGEYAEEPETPTKTGYTFVGWYNGDIKWDFNTPVTEKMTLKAKWGKDAGMVTVTFVSVGEVCASQVLEKGQKATEPSIYRFGYMFVGWYCGNELWVFDTPVNADMTLTAHWEEIKEQIKVETDYNGNAEITIPMGYDIKSLTIENALMNITLPAETLKTLEGKTLYVFIRSPNAYAINQAYEGNETANAEDVFEVVMKVGKEEFKGKATFQVPFDSKKATNPSVYIRTGSGDESIESILKEGNIFFDAEHGGMYVVKYTVIPEPTTNDNTALLWVIALLVVIVSAGCLVTYIFVKKH